MSPRIVRPSQTQQILGPPNPGHSNSAEGMPGTSRVPTSYCPLLPHSGLVPATNLLMVGGLPSKLGCYGSVNVGLTGHDASVHVLVLPVLCHPNAHCISTVHGKRLISGTKDVWSPEVLPCCSSHGGEPPRKQRKTTAVTINGIRAHGPQARRLAVLPPIWGRRNDGHRRSQAGA
jgi:hypothetical protein